MHTHTHYFPVLLCTTKLAQNTSHYCFVLQSLHKALPSTTLYYESCTKHLAIATLYYKACTKHAPARLCTTKLAPSTSQYYFVLRISHKTLPIATLYFKACTNHFPVLLCTTKLAQSTSQYYLVLHSLHKARPSTTLYKACTKHFPVLTCTTKLAQSTSQHYFVLQSLHKALPSTLYYKTCTHYFPVLLCTRKLAQSIPQYYFDYLLSTTKLAQSTSHYYFVLQSLHKGLLSTLYNKACAKHFPLLLCTTKLAVLVWLLSTTKLAQSMSQYHFVLQSLHKARPSTTLYYKACTNIMWLAGIFVRTWQHKETTFMQPWHRDLQPGIPQAHRTTGTWATTRCKTPRENRLRPKQSKPQRSKPQPLLTQGTLHRRLQSLYMEKHKGSCSGFLPNTSPMQQSCRIAMGFAWFCSSSVSHVM